MQNIGQNRKALNHVKYKMENNEFKKECVKNSTCYYFDDINKLEDFDIDNYFDDINKLEDFDTDNILIDEKSHENILIYDISYKTLIGPKSLRIIFDKIYGFIRIYDGTTYLVLSSSEIHDAIYSKIRYLVSLKSSITYVFSLYYAKIKVDFNHSLPIEKRLILHNVIILIKSILKKDRNHYCCNTFSEK